MAKRDFYDVLGVSRNASADEIKRAYRKLAKQYHPDRAKGDASAAAKFTEVQEAYDLLSDPKRREQYDRFGHAGPMPEGGWQEGPGGARVYTWNSRGGGAPADFDFGDLSDLFGGGAGGASIFEELIGGGRRGRRSRRSGAATAPPVRGADLEHEVTLDFEQAVHGTTMQLSQQAPEGGKETISVRIPPGVSDGQRVRVREKGAAGPAGRGDLYIVCRIRPHAYFRREGDDIYLDLPVTLAEAALGGKVSMPTLEGMTVVTIPPGTASGKKLRLSGKGIANPRTGTRGDQYAVIRIVPPAQPTPRQRKLLEELAETGLGNPREGLW